MWNRTDVRVLPNPVNSLEDGWDPEKMHSFQGSGQASV